MPWMPASALAGRTEAIADRRYRAQEAARPARRRRAAPAQRTDRGAAGEAVDGDAGGALGAHDRRLRQAAEDAVGDAGPVAPALKQVLEGADIPALVAHLHDAACRAAGRRSGRPSAGPRCRRRPAHGGAGSHDGAARERTLDPVDEKPRYRCRRVSATAEQPRSRDSPGLKPGRARRRQPQQGPRRTYPRRPGMPSWWATRRTAIKAARDPAGRPEAPFSGRHSGGGGSASSPLGHPPFGAGASSRRP